MELSTAYWLIIAGFTAGLFFGCVIGWHSHRQFMGWINAHDIQNWNYTKDQK